MTKKRLYDGQPCHDDNGVIQMSFILMMWVNITKEDKNALYWVKCKEGNELDLTVAFKYLGKLKCPTFSDGDKTPEVKYHNVKGHYQWLHKNKDDSQKWTLKLMEYKVKNEISNEYWWVPVDEKNEKIDHFWHQATDDEKKQVKKPVKKEKPKHQVKKRKHQVKKPVKKEQVKKRRYQVKQPKQERPKQDQNQKMIHLFNVIIMMRDIRSNSIRVKGIGPKWRGHIMMPL